MFNIINDFINIFSYVIAPVFYKVLYMSIMGTLAGITILIFRKIFDKKITPKWKCIIWIVLIILLLIPIKFEIKTSKKISPLNISGMVESIQDISFRNEYSNVKEEQKAYDIVEGRGQEDGDISQNLQKKTNIIYIKHCIFDIIIPFIWLFGILIYFSLLLIGNGKIKKKTNKNLNDEKLNMILSECKNTLKIKSNIKIVLQQFKKTPAILGILNPKILVTQDFLEEDGETIKFILMHELAHYKRKDLAFNYILIITTMLHWFNPFIWIFFNSIRQDIELATDEFVIEHLENNEIKEYGLTLINSLVNFKEEMYTSKLLCVIDDNKNMERRIKMIKQSNKFSKNKILISCISVLIISCLIFVFFTKNKVENFKENSSNSSSVLSQEELDKIKEEETLGIYTTENGCKYKAFKPSFKSSSDSEYDNYDFTHDMIYQTDENIYYKKIDNYEEYKKVKARWNDIIDLTSEDFENKFMVITAIENTSMLGLGVDKLENDNNTLYISLKLEADLADIEMVKQNPIGMSEEEKEKWKKLNKEFEKTCISYVIPRGMERENIVAVRNLRNDEKNFSTEIQLQYDEMRNLETKSIIYKDMRYRELEKKEKEGLIKLAEMNWKDSLVEKFSIDKDMPDINFSNWESLGDEFYCLRVTDYSEYKKLMNNFNIRKLTRFDFKNIFVIMIVRSNYENSFSAGEIVYDNGLLYKERNSENKEEGPLNLTLPINIDGILDVAENAKYPGILVMVPNYMNLDNSFLKVIKQ